MTGSALIPISVLLFAWAPLPVGQSQADFLEGAKSLFVEPQSGRIFRDAQGHPIEPFGLSYWIELETPVNVGLRVSDKHEFKSGDRIRFHFQSLTEGELYLLYVDSLGTSSLLLPDSFQGAFENTMSPGSLLSVPNRDGWLRFDENPGATRIAAIFAKREDVIRKLKLNARMSRSATEQILEFIRERENSADQLIETEQTLAHQIGTYVVALSEPLVALTITLRHR